MVLFAKQFYFQFWNIYSHKKCVWMKIIRKNWTYKSYKCKNENENVQK